MKTIGRFYQPKDGCPDTLVVHIELSQKDMTDLGCAEYTSYNTRYIMKGDPAKAIEVLLSKERQAAAILVAQHEPTKVIKEILERFDTYLKAGGRIALPPAAEVAIATADAIKEK